MPKIRYNGPEDAVRLSNPAHDLVERVVKRNEHIEVPAPVRDELLARDGESWSEVKSSSSKKEE